VAAVFFMTKEFINPPDLPNWEQVFSQIVVVSNGACRTVYVSGQVSVDKEKNLIGAGDLRAQANQAFRNLLTALQAAGATASDVVRLNIYVRDYKPDDAALISASLRIFAKRSCRQVPGWAYSPWPKTGF
jgi:enamine deaminase RidA (YjgF/YER057c/UK114 family)